MKAKKSIIDYKKAAAHLRAAIIQTEEALCQLDADHEDREKLNDLIDSMSNILSLYEMQAELNVE